MLLKICKLLWLLVKVLMIKLHYIFQMFLKRFFLLINKTNDNDSKPVFLIFKKIF